MTGFTEGSFNFVTSFRYLFAFLKFVSFLLLIIIDSDHSEPNVGSSKNLGRATFRKMPEAGLKIPQKSLKNTIFCQNFAEAPSLARVWLGYFGFWGV